MMSGAGESLETTCFQACDVIYYAQSVKDMILPSPKYE